MTQSRTQRVFWLALPHARLLIVLLLLSAGLSWLTLKPQVPVGAAAAADLAAAVAARSGSTGVTLLVAGAGEAERQFAEAAFAALPADRQSTTRVYSGDPRGLKQLLDQLATEQQQLLVIGASAAASQWKLVRNLPADVWVDSADATGEPPRGVISPQPRMWPAFLKTDNLLNIANQIAVIAVVAVGMTLVILTGGIDLSVGSLLALSAVLCTWLIRWNGGEEATLSWMWLAAGLAITATASLGAVSGMLVTRFRVPPFIATLAMMLVASGLAYLVAEGQSIYAVPESFVVLGRGTLAGVLPNTVVLMLALYVVAELVVTQTIFGRSVVAVGGNAEAARLAGLSVGRITILVYLICGALAGLGGVMMASQLKSGAPTYGQMYELYVIAAVVVGGTSLTGGQGSMVGTLLGALVIAMIQNGMNLANVESYSQKIVLGLVILTAVLLDQSSRRE